VFYQYHTPPLFFNKVEVNRIENSEYRNEYNKLNIEYLNAHAQKQILANELVTAIQADSKENITNAQTKILIAEKQISKIKNNALALMHKNNVKADTNDTNYVFLTFVTTFLPTGLVGLLIAIILLASMGSTAGGLNALASTSVVDFYKRFINIKDSEKGYLSASRWATVFWGIFCVIVAIYASKLGNLIEAVNILGSLFYGTILGIFMVAFFLKKVGGTAVFYAALIAETYIAIAWFNDHMAFLWLNVIGCLLVIVLSWIIQKTVSRKH
jgi:SSS family solute:Na+ symporter